MITPFRVTADHISRGDRRCPRTCPIALSLMEILPDGTYVSVVEINTTIDESPNTQHMTELWYKHHENVVQWIKTYDERDNTEPVELVLDNTNRLIWIKEDYNECIA